MNVLSLDCPWGIATTGCCLCLLPHCPISTVWILRIVITYFLSLGLDWLFLAFRCNLLGIFCNSDFLDVALHGLFVNIGRSRPQICDLYDLDLFLWTRFLPPLFILFHLSTHLVCIDKPRRDFLLHLLKGRFAGSPWGFERRRFDWRFSDLECI